MDGNDCAASTTDVCLLTLIFSFFRGGWREHAYRVVVDVCAEDNVHLQVVIFRTTGRYLDKTKGILERMQNGVHSSTLQVRKMKLVDSNVGKLVTAFAPVGPPECNGGCRKHLLLENLQSL